MAKGKILAVEERDGRTYYRVETPDGVREIETTQARKAESAASEAKDDAKTTEAPPLYQYDLDASLMTVAEYRERKGLPPDARFGSLTIAEYVAANREVFALAAAARTGKTTPDVAPADPAPADPAPAQEPEELEGERAPSPPLDEVVSQLAALSKRMDEVLEILRRGQWATPAVVFGADAFRGLVGEGAVHVSAPVDARTTLGDGAVRVTAPIDARTTIDKGAIVVTAPVDARTTVAPGAVVANVTAQPGEVTVHADVVATLPPPRTRTATITDPDGKKSTITIPGSPGAQ